MRDQIIGFLKQLEAEIPPAAGAHHSIEFAQYGSDESGWEDRLCLVVRARDGATSKFFLEETDWLCAALGKGVASLLPKYLHAA